MQTRRGHLAGLAVTGLGIAGSVRAQDSRFIGTWTGLLKAGSVTLRLRFIITDAKTAKVISLDQGNAEILADTVKLDADRITLGFSGIQATYSGTLKDASHIEGIFSQGGQPLPLNLNRGEAIEETVAPAQPLTLSLLQGLRQQAGTPALGAAWSGKHAAGLLADGLRAADGAVAVSPADAWHWGSITKSMTATLVARLVEAGVVTWETTVASVLGSKVPDMQAAYSPATFLHLLSHRAGLQGNIDMGRLATYSRDSLPDARTERLAYAAEALKQAHVGPLAAQMLYSNNGYIIAGAMLEAITGTSWEQLIRTHVFAPLGLGSAGFGAPGVAGQVDQPLGHALIGDKHQPFPVGPGLINDNPVALGPAGRVHMAMGDMLTYLKAHAGKPEAFLKAASWTTLHTPPFGGDYALGWIVRPDGALWHNGSNTLWYGEVLVDAAQGVVCTVCGNEGNPPTQTAVGQALLAARAAA